MYFPESFYDYKTQSQIYNPNLLAQQGNTFLTERPFSSRSPCLYSSHRQHSFTQHTAPQTAGTQNVYQAYNLPPVTTNQEQRWRPTSCGDSSFGSQELTPRVESSLPAYFRVKPNLMGQNGRRCRKSRTVFTDLQLRILEKTFSDHKYLDTTHRAKVAHTLHLNETQVKTWFQNRRMKWKRESPESTMAVERAKGKDCASMKASDQRKCPMYFASCK